jgi:hypothetical protein
MRAQMKWTLGIWGALVFAFAPGVAGQATPSTEIAKKADAIVGAYRTIIVLLDGAGALDPGVKERAVKLRTGRYESPPTLEARAKQTTAAAKALGPPGWKPVPFGSAA